MKKVVAGLTLIAALLLVMAMPSPAMAVEDSLGAEVTIGAIINFTVEDNGQAGLKFGSLIPGSSDNPELAQNGSGAVTLSLGAETNVNCNVSTKASDFASGSDTIPIGNATWDTDNSVSGATAMTDDYAQITTLSAGNWQDVWHWLSVPGNQAPGIYTTDFYYQALEATS